MTGQVDFKSIFNEGLVAELASRLCVAWPMFDIDHFIACTPELDTLQMKQRVRGISDAISGCLPGDYREALAIVRKAVDPVPALGLSALRGLPVWVPLQFVEDHGLDYFDESMQAMHRFTQLFSAEFAIRPFILRYPEQTLAVLADWTTDPSPDVRRLVSEGMRPRLPWAAQLPPYRKDPTSVLMLLERLIGDPSEYVRRSVANNLNDIAKDNPDRVVDALCRWCNEYAGEPGFEWICRHSCRTLVKAGHKEALSLLGYDTSPSVAVRQFEVDPGHIALGSQVQLVCELGSASDEVQKLVIDYAIHFQKARNLRSRRVFKWANRSLSPGAILQLDRSHPVVPVSVRRYYSGIHEVELLVNGMIVARAEFNLEC